MNTNRAELEDADFEESEHVRDSPSSDPGGADAQEGADAPSPRAETESLQPGAAGDDFDAMRDRHLRLAAEFDNFRKRTERERTESWTRAQAQLMERLLEPMDDLQRVADQDAEKTPAAALLEGIQLVERKLFRALEGAGLETIDPAGEPFDPAVHEALMSVPAEGEAEDETVGDVFQKGYRVKGVLLRPARVQVRKYEG